MTERLFVYGTLRTGERNHAFAAGMGLLSVAPARANGLDLYHLEPEGYPAVVEGDGSVLGEVLTLESGFARLDRLEGVDRPEPRYARVRRRVEVGEDSLEAWIYVYLRVERLSAPGARLVPSGDWMSR